MNLASISNVVGYAEPLLWTAALLAYLRARKQIAIPALGVFLGIRTVSAWMLLGIGQGAALMSLSPRLLSAGYFYTYWAGYLAGNVALYFGLQAIFRNIMAPFAGLTRLGLMVFRWAAASALLVSSVSVAVLSLHSEIHDRLATALIDLGLCFSILVLCLTAFLVFAMRSMGTSWRSRISGICLGLGLLAAMDIALQAAGPFTWPAQISGFVTILALAGWVALFVTPKSAQQQAPAAATASVMQWNDLAQELGTNAPQAPTPQSGFLQNVESVVDRVLAKNAVSS